MVSEILCFSLLHHFLSLSNAHSAIYGSVTNGPDGKEHDIQEECLLK